MNKEEFIINIDFSEQINNLKVKAILFPESDRLVAFVQLDFGFIKIKGCTVKWKDFGTGEEILVFDLPAYKTAFKYVKCVYFPNVDQYKEMTARIVKEVGDRLETINKYKAKEPEIDLDTIPDFD